MKAFVYFSGVVSLQEANKKFKELCHKLHPDKGGDHMAFIDMFTEYKEFISSFRFGDKEQQKRQDWQAKTYAKHSDDIMWVIRELLKIRDIDFDLVGTWIWVTSPKHRKDDIKSIKDLSNFPEHWVLHWNSNKNRWVFHDNSYKKQSKRKFTYQEVKSMWYCEEYESDRTKEVTV